MVLRDQLSKILDFVQESKNIVIYGDLGNGKTMLLRQVKTYLTVNSIRVYDISDSDGDYIGDIDFLSKSRSKGVFPASLYEIIFSRCYPICRQQ